MQKQCTDHTKFFYTIAMHYKKLYYIILINEIIITSYITIYTDYTIYTGEDFQPYCNNLPVTYTGIVADA